MIKIQTTAGDTAWLYEDKILCFLSGSLLNPGPQNFLIFYFGMMQPFAVTKIEFHRVLNLIQREESNDSRTNRQVN